MISPLAYVDPSAKLGKNVTVHPFAYIDKNVEIGDDNVIMPYASLMSGTRMGNGNTVYQGAVVAAVPQDFAFTGEETLAIIGNNNVIRENAVIIRGTHASHATKVGDGNFIMSGARLSHDVEVGNRCIIGNGSQVSGNCIIYDNAILTSNVLMQGNTRLGSFSAHKGFVPVGALTAQAVVHMAGRKHKPEFRLQGQQDAQQCHAVRPAGHCRSQVQRLARTKQLFSQNKHAHMRQNFFIVHQRLKSTSIKRVWAPSQPSGTVLVSP